MSYLAPTSTAEALAFLRDVEPKVIAGCTDYFPSQKAGHVPAHILDITRIAGMRGITQSPDGWRIGAATTWTDIIKADLPPAFDALKQAAGLVGSVQIQNRGTVAGNICNASPAADGVPPLLALDAQIEIASQHQTRVVPLTEFITGVRTIDLSAGELVTAVLIPPIKGAARSAFVKLGSRTHLVISIAMVAVVVTVKDGFIAQASIAVGSCAPVGKRLPLAEDRLIGLRPQDVSENVFDNAALAPLAAITDVRGTADYRLDVVRTLCSRAIELAVGPV